ncbi:hypothetical protein L1049_022002 [Liquidambar formosana]|uniref:Uncharacterized protein n=1 Tax=Liquidambar formosana TaxID=63359 RepID=A0AAP0WQH8_LIQFO
MEKEANCEASDEKDELKGVLGDDLFARFAALKASLPSSVPPNTSDGGDQSVRPNENGDTEDDDEVEKIIQWAKDAARLDPSSATDDDDDDGNDEKEEEDEDDDGDDNNHGDRVEGDKRGKEQK